VWASIKTVEAPPANGRSAPQRWMVFSLTVYCTSFLSWRARRGGIAERDDGEVGDGTFEYPIIDGPGGKSSQAVT
jgi:hypothetical protein